MRVEQKNLLDRKNGTAERSEEYSRSACSVRLHGAVGARMHEFRLVAIEETDLLVGDV